MLSPMAFCWREYLYGRKRIAVEPVALFSYRNTTFGVSVAINKCRLDGRSVIPR